MSGAVEHAARGVTHCPQGANLLVSERQESGELARIAKRAANGSRKAQEEIAKVKADRDEFSRLYLDHVAQCEACAAKPEASR